MTYGEATREAQEAVQNLRRIEREHREQTERLAKARAAIDRHLSLTAPEEGEAPPKWMDACVAPPEQIAAE